MSRVGPPTLVVVGLVAAVAPFASFAPFAIASCSLGLDESLIANAGMDDGATTPPPDAALESAARPDTGPDGGDAASGDASVGCTSDDACTSTSGCATGSCDVARGVCTYRVCRPSACNAAICDRAAGTCGAAAPYPLKASTFPLGAKLSCTKCLAAVHSWLFAVTASGVVAFDVSNPSSSAPPRVPIVGLGFVPSALVASGERVWMLGAIAGESPSRIQLAYVEPPRDPFAAKIEAVSVLGSYNRKAETTSLFARAGDSALLVGQTAAFSSAILEAPIAEPFALGATPTAPITSYAPAAVSGSRLLMSAVVSQAASFYLVDGAGTATPTNGAVTTVTSTATVSTARTFASAADGTVFWATGAHQGTIVGPTTRAARAYFLVPGATDAIDAAEGIDIELYNASIVGGNASIFGAAQASSAMVDSKTALVAMQARENDKQTAVQFVRRDPIAVVKLADGSAPRRQILPVKIGNVVAAAGTNGIGYLVANDDDGPSAGASVFVLDPACEP